MRTDRRTRGVAAATLASFALGIAAPAAAQTAPPEPPMYQPPAQPGYPQGGQGQPYYPQQPGQPYPQQPGQPYDPQQPQQPPGYAPPVYALPGPRTPIRYDLRPRYGLIAGGAAMTGAMWLISVAAAGITAAVSDICNAASTSSAGCVTTPWPLFVPVAGPFIQMGYVSGNGANAARVLLAFDGIVQLGGLAMIIAGALARKRVPVYADRLQVAPMATLGGGGLLAQGRF